MKVNYSAILRKLKEVSSIDTKPVEFVKSGQADCPNCTRDAYSGASTDPSCPMCGGKGYIISDVVKVVNSGVEYISGLETIHQIGATVQKGDVVVTIHESQLTIAGFRATDFLNTRLPVDFFRINGKKYEIVSVTPGELDNVLYELVLHLRTPSR